MGDFSFTVFDEAANPMAGALVTIYELSTPVASGNTDANGEVEFLSYPYSGVGYRVEKAGYNDETGTHYGNAYYDGVYRLYVNMTLESCEENADPTVAGTNTVAVTITAKFGDQVLTQAKLAEYGWNYPIHGGGLSWGAQEFPFDANGQIVLHVCPTHAFQFSVTDFGNAYASDGAAVNPAVATSYDIVIGCASGYGFNPDTHECELGYTPPPEPDGPTDCTICARFNVNPAGGWVALDALDVPEVQALGNDNRVDQWFRVSEAQAAHLVSINPQAATVVEWLDWDDPYSGRHEDEEVGQSERIDQLTDGAATGLGQSVIIGNQLKQDELLRRIIERQHEQGRWMNELNAALYERLGMLSQLVQLLGQALAGEGWQDVVNTAPYNKVFETNEERANVLAADGSSRFGYPEV